jgi:hypothetical protein
MAWFSRLPKKRIQEACQPAGISGHVESEKAPDGPGEWPESLFSIYNQFVNIFQAGFFI